MGHSHTPGPIQCTAPMAAPCASKSTHSSPSSKPQIRTFPLPRPSAAWPPAQDRDGGQGGGDWRVGPPSFGRGSTPTTRGLAHGSRAPELNSKRVLGGPNAAVQKAHANCIAPNTPAAAPQSHGPYFFVEVRGPVASPHAGTPPPPCASTAAVPKAQAKQRFNAHPRPETSPCFAIKRRWASPSGVTPACQWYVMYHGGAAAAHIVQWFSTAPSGVSEAVLSVSEAVLSVSEAVLSVSEAVLSVSEAVLSVSEAVLSVSEAVLSVSEAVLSVSEAVLSVSEAVLSVSQAVLSVSQAVLSVSEAVLSVSEAVLGHRTVQSPAIGPHRQTYAHSVHCHE